MKAKGRSEDEYRENKGNVLLMHSRYFKFLLSCLLFWTVHTCECCSHLWLATKDTCYSKPRSVI